MKGFCYCLFVSTVFAPAVLLATTKAECDRAAIGNYITSQEPSNEPHYYCFQDVSKDEKVVGLELARNAKKTNDRKLAAFLYLNLIGKNPADFEMLEEYVKFVSESEAITKQELDELYSLVMVSVFKVPAVQVKKVLDMSQKIQTKRDDIAKKETGEVKANPRDLVADADRLLRQADPPPIGESALRKMILDGNNLMGEFDQESQKYKELEALVEEISIVVQAVQKKEYIEACLKRLESESLDSDFALSIIQAAESTLPTLYGLKIPASRMPPELKKAIDLLPNEVKKKVEKISSKRSEKTLEELRNLVNELLAIPHDEPVGTWEILAKKIEEKAKVIQAKISGITSADSVSSAATEIVKVQERLNKIRRSQYNAYQLWAVGQLNQAFIEYNEFKWVSLGSNKAWNILINNKIHSIDIGLMSPDASRCYNDIVPKLLAKFYPKDLPAWYQACVDMKKVALEDK
jgi:hypothetical protein